MNDTGATNGSAAGVDEASDWQVMKRLYTRQQRMRDLSDCPTITEICRDACHSAATPTRLSRRVASRRHRRCVQNLQLAHDECRRIRSTIIWKLNIVVWLREFWSILKTFSTMTLLCRHLSPTAQEIGNWVTTADGCVHTADTTQLDFAVGKFVQTCLDCRQLR